MLFELERTFSHPTTLTHSTAGCVTFGVYSWPVYKYLTRIMLWAFLLFVFSLFVGWKWKKRLSWENNYVDKNGAIFFCNSNTDIANCSFNISDTCCVFLHPSQRILGLHVTLLKRHRSALNVIQAGGVRLCGKWAATSEMNAVIK